MSTAINQIDYSERDVGKMNPESKREVAFRFTINGKEYDLVLTWSFSSGKQSIFVNGIEEVFSRNSGASLIDRKFEFDGSNFHLIGTRTRPKGVSYDYKCFELLINGTLLSDCPSEGCANLPPSTEGKSILDLLYPNHACRKRRGAPASETKGHMYACAGGEKQPCAPVNAAPMPSPSDHPVANSAPDLLLDFNPVGTVANNGNSIPSSDFLVPTEQPTYNNYSMFSQPQTDASNAFGGQMQVASSYGSGAPQPETSDLFGGQMAMANTYGPPSTNGNDTSNPFGVPMAMANSYGPHPTTTNGASNPFGDQMTVASSYGPPPTTNDASNPFGGQMTVASSYGPPPTTMNDAANPFGGQMSMSGSYGPPPTTTHDASNPFGGSTVVQTATNHYSYNAPAQPAATNNYNYNSYDAQPPFTANAPPLLGGAPQPPTSPVYGFNASGYPAPNAYESSINSASHGAAVDPMTQFGAPPVPYNAMQTTDTTPYGAY